MATYNSIISRADAQPLMPEEVSNAFLKGAEGFSSVLADFTHVPVGRAQVRFPVLSALPVAYWVTGDTGLKQTTEINWDNKFLNIEEIAVIVPVPDNVIDDSGTPIWSQVEESCQTAIARVVDEAVYFGVNAPGTFPEDLVAAATAAGNHAVVGTNTAALGGIVGDQADLLALIEADGYDPTQGVAARGLKSLFRKARNTQGERYDEVTVSKDAVEADGVSWSFPMRGQWPSAVSTARGILYDASEYIVGIRKDITLTVHTEGVIQGVDGVILYNLMQQDMSAIRLVLRVGWQVANTINYDQPTEADRYPAGVLLAAAA